MENFKKALELEPDNESYKSNLQIAEDKVKSGVAPGGGMGGMFPGMGGGQWTLDMHLAFHSYVDKSFAKEVQAAHWHLYMW